jgi:hypothetical protein
MDRRRNCDHGVRGRRVALASRFALVYLFNRGSGHSVARSGCGSRAVPGSGRSNAPPPGSSKARTDVARFRRPRTRTGCLSASRGAFVQRITVDRIQGARFVQRPARGVPLRGPPGWSSRLRIRRSPCGRPEVPPPLSERTHLPLVARAIVPARGRPLFMVMHVIRAPRAFARRSRRTWQIS